MTDRIRTLGGFTIAFGVLWLAIGITTVIVVGAVVGDSPNRVDHELADVVQDGIIWASVLLMLMYVGAGIGLLNGQSWSRPATLALWPITMFIPLLGWAMGIAMIVVLIHDREDAEFGVRVSM